MSVSLFLSPITLISAAHFLLDHPMSFRYSFYGTKKRERTALSTVRSFSRIPVCLPYTGSCPSHEAPAPPTYIMIRENSLFCKLVRIKSSSKILFDSFMAGFRSELQTSVTKSIRESSTARRITKSYPICRKPSSPRNNG